MWALQAQTKVEETQQALEYLTAAEEGKGSALGQCLVLCSDLRKVQPKPAPCFLVSSSNSVSKVLDAHC